MEQLGAIGLVRQESRTTWACTPRGKRVASIGEAFHGQTNMTVEVSSADWELGPGDYAVPFEAETAQDVGYLPEEDTRLDQKSALEIVSGHGDNGSTRRDSERARRRHRAAVGVLVYSWLTRRPDPVGAAARIEPCDFACHVYDWQITHPQGPVRPVQERQAARAPSSRAQQVPPVPAAEGLADKLFRWFFGG